MEETYTLLNDYFCTFLFMINRVMIIYRIFLHMNCHNIVIIQGFKIILFFLKIVILRVHYNIYFNMIVFFETQYYHTEIDIL